jgi:hypothetical protein
MSNRRHDRNRRQRRPPPRGFTGRGWGEFYRIALPLEGSQKRAFFNRLSRYSTAAAGVIGTIVGYGAGGVLGAAIGAGLGVTSAARYLVRNRFHRR